MLFTAKSPRTAKKNAFPLAFIFAKTLRLRASTVNNRGSNKHYFKNTNTTAHS